MNSTWLITSKLANQHARKVLFTCVVDTNLYYSPTWRYCAHYEDEIYNPYTTGSSSVKKKNTNQKKEKLNQLYILYSNTVCFWHYQGIQFTLQLHLSLDRCNCSMNFFFADFVVYSRLLCTTNKREMCQLALNSLKKILKRKKSISDLLIMADFPNVLWLASQLLRHRWMQEWHHSIRLYHQSQCNHFHSPQHCCFRFHRCRLHQRFIFSFVSVSLNLVCSRSVPSGFIWRSQCLVRCFSSLWCVRYLFSSGTRCFFSFVGSSKNLSKHNPHNFLSVAFWLPFSLSSALFFLKPTTSRCLGYKQKHFA